MDHHFVSDTCTRCGEARESVGESSVCSGGYEEEPRVPEVVLASRSDRFVAQVLDAIVAVGLSVALWVGLGQLLGGEQSVVLGFMGLFYYRLMCDGYSGRSIGKRALRIQVIRRESDTACGFGGSLVRNLSLWMFGIFDVLFILGGNKRRLGDYIAGTTVIKVSARTRPRKLSPATLARAAHHLVHVVVLGGIAALILQVHRSVFHSDVHVFNDSPIPVEVRIGEHTRQLAAEERVKIENVGVGDHHLRVSGLDGEVIEEQDVTIPGGNDLVAYNVLGAAPIFLMEQIYGDEGDGLPEPDYIDLSGTRWVTREDVGYVLRDAPDEVYVGFGETYRSIWTFDQESGGWRTSLANMGIQDRYEELESLARGILEHAGEGESVTLDVLGAVEVEGPYELYVELTEGALERFPGSLGLHRMKQDQRLWYGEVRELRDAYSELFAESPDSADLAYLAARLMPPLEALEETVALLERFPESPELLELRGWALHQLGEFERARPFLERALDAQPRWTLDLVETAAGNLLALGRGKDARDLIRDFEKRVASTSREFAVLSARVHFAGGRTKQSKSTIRVLEARYGIYDWDTELVMWLRGGGTATPELDAASVEYEGLRSALTVAQALERGPEEALAAHRGAEVFASKYLDSPRLVALACAYLAEGERAEGEELLGEVWVPAHVLESTVLEPGENPHAPELSWEIRAVLELFEGLNFAPGSPERAEHFERARTMDFMKGIAWRAAEQWK